MFSRKRVYGSSFGAPTNVFIRPQKRFRGAQQSVKRGMRYPTTLHPRISARAPISTQVSQIRRQLRQTAPEIKYVDIDTSTTNVTTSGAVVYASGIAQGDTLGTRAGEGVRLKSLSFKGRLVMPSDANSSNNKYTRIFVFRDKQNAQATPAIGLFLDYPSDPVLARPSLETLSRFELMYVSPIYDHRRLVADDTDTAAVPTQSNLWDWSWRGDIELRYFGTGAADLDKNPIYVVYVTSDSGNVMDSVSNMRLGFTDA